jgi:DNA polymerase-3 subunit alpha
MATFVLEDLSAAMEVMVFPRAMTDHGHALEDDAIVCVKGRLDTRDDAPKMIAMEITRPDLVLDGGPPVRLRTKPGALSEDRITRLKALLLDHPGESQVFVQLEGAEKVTVLRLGDEFCVEPTGGLFAELRILLGADCIA